MDYQDDRRPLIRLLNVARLTRPAIPHRLVRVASDEGIERELGAALDAAGAELAREYAAEAPHCEREKSPGSCPAFGAAR